MASKFAVKTLILAAGLLATQATAQVLPVAKVNDPASRVLQRQHMAVLEQIGTEAKQLHFAYPFYFSQALDIDEPRQKLLPQGSIHFDNFNGQTVLAITGNYYISYSAEAMNHNQRARRTYEDVVLPLLKIEIAHLDRSIACDAFAFEIAHHVRGKAMKVWTEGPENLTMVIPRAVAERLVKATDLDSRQGALLESEVFLNAEPLTLWLSGEDAPSNVRDHYLARHERRKAKPQDGETAQGAQAYEPGTLVSAKLIPQSELAAKIREGGTVHREVSPAELEKLQTRYAPEVKKLTTDLSGAAHFVDYAPPSFISFRDGAYLQLSVTTQLEQPAGSSQYRLAALAFDNHVSHLLRPVSKTFHGDPQFQGVNFSTTIHGPGQSSATSVEFVVPFTALACYERYDCTGQELINRSVVLINGERGELNLMQAEADPQPRP